MHFLFTKDGSNVFVYCQDLHAFVSAVRRCVISAQTTNISNFACIFRCKLHSKWL